MSCKVTVECQRPAEFESSDYIFANDWDKYRTAIILDREIMSKINCEPFGYIEAIPADRSFDNTSSKIILAVPFEESPENDSPSKACLRTNLMDEIYTNSRYSELIHIRRYCGNISAKLTTFKEYSDDISEGLNCYVHPNILNKIGESKGDYLEAYNPITGGRIALQAWPLRPDDKDNRIRIGDQLRKVLNININDEIVIRSVVQTSEPKLGSRERIINPLVRYRQFALRTVKGLDRDEHRNVVRVSDDLMNLLGIDSGDQVVLEWNNSRTISRCLSPPNSEIEPFSIRVPSTVRDKIGVSLEDGLYIRRNMEAIVKKKVSLSLLVIIGVTISGIRFFNSYTINIIIIFCMIVFASIVVLWIVFLPERQQVEV
jgi:hypothetical protein